MTPQERAAAVKHVVYMFGVPEFEVECGEYENALAATVTLQREARRAALLEARKAVVSEYLQDPVEDDPGDIAYDHAIRDAVEAIDRLAQEG